MKIAVGSDIHLEFGDLDIPNSEQADVLILSGDVCVAADIGRLENGQLTESEKSTRIRDFFQRVSRDFEHVIYVMGNHEHYHGDFVKTQAVLQQMLQQQNLDNVYLLEKQSQMINGHLFVGGTLWTDFDGGNPVYMLQARQAVNDYRCVKNSQSGKHGSGWKFTPQHARQDHQQMINYLRSALDTHRQQSQTSGPVIVVGHHAPSTVSIHPKYQHDSMLSSCYCTDLSDLILDYPEIMLWTHGHTHEQFDYTIGTTRVICNPRGYFGYEPRAQSWKLKTIKI